MSSANAVSNPLSPTEAFKLHDGTPSVDAMTYRQLLGSMQYLSLTQLDISYVVNKLSQFMHAPSTTHLTAVKRVLRYLKGTSHHGILIRHCSPL